MKRPMKFLLVAIFGAVTIFSQSVFAQQTDKDLKGDIKEKATKEARKEAKKYVKDGWYTSPGALPMDKQIEKAWMRQYEEDDKGNPKFLVASGNSVAGTQQAAKLQSTELAKLELAGMISTSVAALIENNVATQQLDNADAATIQETVAAAKSIIAQELTSVVQLFELYRKIDKNVESSVRIAYSSDMAKEAAKKVIKKELEEKTKLGQEKLDKLMNF
jgi:hypothetical protein